MKNYTEQELSEILSLHSKHLKGETGGQVADLRGANLRDADLRDADLRDADLRDANLRDADLRDANLRGADLRDANLRGAYLRDANLRGADLRCANLTYANLRGADLRGANLTYANLRDADLRDADLRCAHLTYAYLRDANLRGADLSGAYLPYYQICPEEGSFVAYKKTTKGVIKVLIPESAERTNSLVGRKCRTSKLVVLGGEGVGGTGPNYSGIIYNEGETITCPDYDGDIRVECTKGLHFFMTRKEAEEWH